MAKNDLLELAKSFTLWGARTLVVDAGKQLVDRIASQVMEMDAGNGPGAWAKASENERNIWRARMGNTLTVLAMEGSVLSAGPKRKRKK